MQENNNEEVNDIIKQDDIENDENINKDGIGADESGSAGAEVQAADGGGETVSGADRNAEAEPAGEAPISSIEESQTPPPHANQPEKTGESTWKFLYPAVVLAAISVIVALLLAVLNSFTAGVISGRLEEEKNAAIKELFGDIKPPKYLDTVFDAPVNEIMEVYSTSDTFLGYCVSVSPKGFKGKINMLAAINPNGEVIKVKVLDMSETAGIGTNVATDYFLGQFAGKKQGIRANSASDNSIDTISGATVSSNAVLKGINAALDAVGKIKPDSQADTEKETDAPSETTENVTEEESK